MIHQISHLDLRQKFGLKKKFDSRGTYNTNSQIKFETSMLKSNLCDYSDAYIHLKSTISIENTAAAVAAANNANK